MHSKNPAVILLLSGKRKSGKDYVAEKLHNMLDVKSNVLHLSASLKDQYAQQHNLDYRELLTSGSYKETFRENMVRWGEQIRTRDPAYFCKLAVDSVNSDDQVVWIVADCRRPTDLEFFISQRFSDSVVLCVRIEANEHVRIARGWKFTEGIDDADTECALDGKKLWDFIVYNNNDHDAIAALTEIVVRTQSLVKLYDES